MRTACTAALLLAAAAVPLRAQFVQRLTVGAGGTGLRVRAETPAGVTLLSGIAIGGVGRIGGGRVALEVGYRQATLTADSGSGPAEDLVEGRVMLAARPLPWLTVRAGPHARAFVTAGGTERWLLFEGRARAEGGVAGGVVQTYVELWTAAGGSVNVGSGSPTARGGEVGLTVRLPRSPVWLRLSYDIDHAALSSSGNARTVEGIGVTLGVGH